MRIFSTVGKFWATFGVLGSGYEYLLGSNTAVLGTIFKELGILLSIGAIGKTLIGFLGDVFVLTS